MSAIFLYEGIFNLRPFLSHGQHKNTLEAKLVRQEPCIGGLFLMHIGLEMHMIKGLQHAMCLSLETVQSYGIQRISPLMHYLV
jgi:hypothetical protein